MPPNRRSAARAPQQSTPEAAPPGPRPRLVRLTITNFRAIGAAPVCVDLEDIVVLVGPNNAGKSSILAAYELIMSDGARAGELTLEDFPDGKVDPDNPPSIELDTIVFDDKPGPEWMAQTADGAWLVRERWTWPEPGRGIRRGFNVERGRWAADDDPEKVPWGAAAVANARRPQPHRVDAFARPDEQAMAVAKLLQRALQERVKAQSEMSGDPESDYARLMATIEQLQKKVLADAQADIREMEDALTQQVAAVFPGQRVSFDPSEAECLDGALSLFKGTPVLRMGMEGGFSATLERQGSGARRTLLWAAIRVLAESALLRRTPAAGRPYVLLLDEPEMCLHPSAVREACRLLYELPQVTGKWQVMITTHSPCFVDFARDHTSFVRVSRNEHGGVVGTTIFRPTMATFDADERKLLKLLNMCDPYVAEFFFGGVTVLVEGDTEYTAFKYVMARTPDAYRGIHIVRARGKATLVALAKILNQFGTPYALLHDADSPTVDVAGEQRANPAWEVNRSILEETKRAAGRSRLVASVPNFERAYLQAEYRTEKPYRALHRLMEDGRAFAAVKALLDCLVDPTGDVPPGACAWQSMDDLHQQSRTAVPG